ncbi:MAG: glycosyltransferase family 4 protein [Bacteroidota bacterium]
MHFFVVPDMFDLPSGGNLYNARLTEALAQLVPSIVVMDWEAFLDERREGMFWIDTLYMDHWASNPLLRTGQTVGLLVHHLESLYPPEGVHSDQYFEAHEREILAQFDAFLVTSPFTRQYLLRRGFSADDIFVVPPATDPQSSSVITHEGGLRAIMVANLIDRKGILDWLKVLAEGLEESDVTLPVSLTIIGSDQLDPAYAAACHTCVADSDVLTGCVRLAGECPHSDVLAAYAESNLFVSTARMETFGMALQEAHAIGLPILALDGGHIAKHVQQGKNGYVFQDILALREVFLSLARVPIFRQRLIEGAATCRPDSEYDWSAAAKRYLALTEAANLTSR